MLQWHNPCFIELSDNFMEKECQRCGHEYNKRK